MYVAPGLLFLHVPRSAGTFVTNILERGGSGSRSVGGLLPHDGVRKVGELASGRLVFGCVRDPWSWYLSFYSSFKNHKTGGLLGPLGEVCGNGADFKKALAAMTKPVGQALVHSPKYPGHPAGIPQLGRGLRSSGIGLWSWYLATTFCLEEVESMEGLSGLLSDGADLPWSVDVLLDAATVEDGLSRLLHAWGGPRSTETASLLTRAPPVNESPPNVSWRGVRPSGKPDPRWWDEESIEAVLEVDGGLLERFGFGSPVGARPSFHLMRESSAGP